MDAHPELDVINFKTMRDIVDHVEEKLSYLSIFVEWTRDSVLDIQHTYYDSFKSLRRKFDNIGYRKPYIRMEYRWGYSDDFWEELRQVILEVEIEPDPADVKTAFVSGHLDLTEEEFTFYYAKPIEIAHSLGHNIVVGDARGCDEMTQRFISTLEKSKSKTFVYHIFEA